MVLESVIEVVEREYTECPSCLKNAVVEKLLVEKIDTVRGYKWRDVVYWLKCPYCGLLMKY